MQSRGCRKTGLFFCFIKPQRKQFILHSRKGVVRLLRAQGAIESASPTARTCRGQGATEYLVLLAVVLIIALVAIALLGFFPGTTSDAQIAESQIYWQSASPIAITEMAARLYYGGSNNAMYIRLRNSGAYPIRITKVLGNGQWVSQVYTGAPVDIGPLYYMAPGEEKYFANVNAWTVPTERAIDVYRGSSGSYAYVLIAASTVCNNVSPYGYLQINKFGFEYTQYVETQQITKQFIGAKPLIIKCRESFYGG